MGKGSREKAGLRPGGVTVVITDLAVMRFNDVSGEMYLDQYYPGVTPDQVLDQMEFGVDVSRATEAIRPHAEELRILREKCDPQRLILG
jgi:glutaconate CoA-transferase subunit B